MCVLLVLTLALRIAKIYSLVVENLSSVVHASCLQHLAAPGVRKIGSIQQCSLNLGSICLFKPRDLNLQTALIQAVLHRQAAWIKAALLYGTNLAHPLNRYCGATEIAEIGSLIQAKLCRASERLTWNFCLPCEREQPHLFIWVPRYWLRAISRRIVLRDYHR